MLEGDMIYGRKSVYAQEERGKDKTALGPNKSLGQSENTGVGAFADRADLLRLFGQVQASRSSL